jgi:dTDP-4-dehydrorhamnose 3,5-epimerase and related enzymes
VNEHEANPFAAIPGVIAGRLVSHGDSRGAFVELWRARDSNALDGLPAVQANLSTSAEGVLRGMHLHRRQVDRWIVVGGVAYVALVDVRPQLQDPAGLPLIGTAVMGPDDTVTMIGRVAHGFLALEPLQLVYFVTNMYDGSDELGFAWDDPAVGISWPRVPTSDGRPILSDRDGRNPALSDLLEGLRS